MGFVTGFMEHLRAYKLAYGLASALPAINTCSSPEYVISGRTNPGRFVQPEIAYYSDAVGNYDGVASEDEIRNFMSELENNGKLFMVTQSSHLKFMPWKGDNIYKYLSEAVESAKRIRTPVVGIVEFGSDGKPVGFYDVSGSKLEMRDAPQIDIDKEMKIRTERYREYEEMQKKLNEQIRNK